MTRTSEERAETNRKNAQKSTGPTSDAGKRASRCNALKHGLAATTIEPVDAPGEPEGAYQDRLGAWVDDLQPRNVLETAMVQRACRASWKLDRCARYEDAAAARRRARGTGRTPGESARQTEAVQIGSRLMFAIQWVERGKRFGPADDGEVPTEPCLFDDAPRDFEALCGFREGIAWLLQTWADILPNLPAPGDPPPEGADVVIWRTRQRARRLLGIPTGVPGPAQPLREAGEAEVRRLRSLLATFDPTSDDRRDADLTLFRDDPEARLLMRYESQAERELHRAVTTLLKLRKDPDLVPPPEPEPVAEPVADPAPAPESRIEPAPAQNEATPAVPPTRPLVIPTAPVVGPRAMIGGP